MEFRKDLRHLTWEEVFARQQERAFLIPDWLDGLYLSIGDHVLDLGAGPGYVSLRMAEQVGPTGLVYAIDRETEALSYLQAQVQQNAVTNVRCLVADVCSLHLDDEWVSAALLSMILHHRDDPVTLVGHVATLLPSGARVVIAEFHPDGPARSGPPRDARLAPELLEQWCRKAKLHVLHYNRQSDEHYMLTAQRE